MSNSQRDMAPVRLTVLAATAMVVLLGVPGNGFAQTASAPHQSGTVKATGDHTLTLTTQAGADYTVNIPADAKLLEVPPGSKDLKSASTIAFIDIAAGDQAIVSGSDGDTGTSLTARRIIVMKSAAIAAGNAATEEAWRKGLGGIVKSVDPATGTIQVSSGSTILTVQTTATTQVKRYAGNSVRFADAVDGKLSDIHPGDQLRARGARTGDGSSLRADAITSGEFQNLSGLLTAVDGTAHTVTLKDLATKKTVVVNISSKSDLRRLPPQAAARFAARASGQGVSSAGTSPGSAGAAASGPGGSAAAGLDLSQLLPKLPEEVLGGLKTGDAVMIVASGNDASPTAVTLLVGVDPILRAAPEGELTLAPWNVGSSGADAATGQ